MSLEKFSNLDLILDNVHKKIRIEKEDSRQAYKLFDQMRKEVTKTINESNSLLKELRCGNTDRGSFFGGVKVGKPDEFDIDMKLKLPFDYSLIKIALTEPGYININIKEAYELNMKTPSWAEKYADMKKFMDKDGFLVLSKIQTEIESMFTCRFGAGYFFLDFDDGIKAKVIMRKSGPAFTFELNVDDLKISIDFVFVIYFDQKFWPPTPVRTFEYTSPKSVNCYWFAVPKLNENPLSWRLSFPHQESFYLDGSNGLKMIYRLLKALRDAENWQLASYHIATLFLWKSMQEINNSKFWQQSKGTLYMHMLSELKSAVEKHTIPFFWDSRCNMIADAKPATLDNIANRISNIQRQVQLKYTDVPALETFIFTKVYRIKNDNVNGKSNVVTVNGNNNVTNVKDPTLVKSTTLPLSTKNNSDQNIPKSQSTNQVKMSKKTTQVAATKTNQVATNPTLVKSTTLPLSTKNNSNQNMPKSKSSNEVKMTTKTTQVTTTKTTQVTVTKTTQDTATKTNNVKQGTTESTCIIS